jgi:hypothetical protein
MKKSAKHFVLWLSAAMTSGFLIGWIFCPTTDKLAGALLFSAGSGLFYLHRRWLKNLRKSDGDINVKSVI